MRLHRLKHLAVLLGFLAAAASAGAQAAGLGSMKDAGYAAADMPAPVPDMPSARSGDCERK